MLKASAAVKPVPADPTPVAAPPESKPATVAKSPTVPPPEKKPPPPPSKPSEQDISRTTEEEKKEKKEIEDAKRRTQSLWELSEPFEKVIKSRRKRLAKMNYLLEMTKQKLNSLEKDGAPVDEGEREKLKYQIEEIMNEKEEIVNIEDGIAEMERIYRNLLALQESELQKKQEALKNRLQTFEEKIEEWTHERDGLKSREHDLRSRESEIQMKLRDIEQRELSIVDKEKEIKEKMRELRREELDIMKMKFTGDSSSLETQKGLGNPEDGANAKVVPVESGEGPGPDQEEINRRIRELEEQVTKAVEEREKLKEVTNEFTKDQVEVKRILKILDDLLEKLPDDEIKKFADSEAFKLYEKVLEKFEM
jgi:chromosome segregation ATPase